MRSITALAILGAVSAALLAAIAIWGDHAPSPPAEPARAHVLLIGASIGREWHLAEWPSRVQTSRFTAESLAAWQFDKSEAVHEALARPGRVFRLSRTYFRSLFQPPPKRPDIVILKECSSYFPGDLLAYENAVRTWVRQLESRNLAVMLATVAPVTKSRAARDPGKQDSIRDYNRWIREYARSRNIPVLDLEAALRTEDGAWLRDDFAAPDGSHLNASAYAVLDRTLLTTLCNSNLSSN